MRRYINHVQSKDPHERRAHSLRIAGAFTAVLFVGWLGTLGMRLSSGEANLAGQGNPSQAASVLTGFYVPESGLEVASTSYSGY